MFRWLGSGRETILRIPRSELESFEKRPLGKIQRKTLGFLIFHIKHFLIYLLSRISRYIFIFFSLKQTQRVIEKLLLSETMKFR